MAAIHPVFRSPSIMLSLYVYTEGLLDKVLSNPFVLPPVPVICISFCQSANVMPAHGLDKNRNLLPCADIKRSTFTLPVMSPFDIDAIPAVPVEVDFKVRKSPVISVPLLILSKFIKLNGPSIFTPELLLIVRFCYVLDVNTSADMVWLKQPAIINLESNFDASILPDDV